MKRSRLSSPSRPATELCASARAPTSRIPGVAPDGQGTRLTLQVVPRAGRTEFAGAYGDEALRLRLAAPPVDGKANRELMRFLAEELDVPVASVMIVGGQTGRHKVVHITGLTPHEVSTRLGLSEGMPMP